MSEITKVLAFNMKRLRGLRNLTQSELAEKMEVSSGEVSTGTIAAYEGMRRWPELEFLEAMGRVFKVETEELFRPIESEVHAEKMKQAIQLVPLATTEELVDIIRVLSHHAEPALKGRQKV